MKPKNFNISFLIIAITLLSIITVFNYVVDPYGINQLVKREGFNFNKPEFVWHTRQLKPFLSDMIKPNTVFLGNSRMEYLAPERYFSSASDITCFNFGLSSGTSCEMLELMQYTHRNYNISRAIYGLDFIAFSSFSPDFKSTFDFDLARGDKFKIIEKLKMYLSYQAISKSFDCIKSNRTDPKGFHVVYQYNINGSRTNRWRELNLEKKGNDWIKHELQGSYNLYKGIYSSGDLHVPETRRQAYEELIAFINNNDIEYTAFVSPLFESHFKLLLASHSFDEYINWLEFLSKHNGYYYLGGVNEITSDTSLFWDTQHPRKEMSNKIFNTIFYQQDLTPDSLWGVYIDENNFAMLKAELMSQRELFLRDME